MGETRQRDTQLLNRFLKVIKQVGIGLQDLDVLLIPVRQSLQLHILKLRKWHYHITDLLVWFGGGSKEKKMSAKLPTASGWDTPGSMHTVHGLWFRWQSLGWAHLDSTPYSALHCETSGTLSNLSGIHLFNLSNRRKNTPQHKALLPWGVRIHERLICREKASMFEVSITREETERERHTHIKIG